MEGRRAGRPRTIDPDAVSLVALRLFDDLGFDNVSMDDVAAAAGVSRRSLFRLFPAKGTMVWGGLAEFTERFRAALAAADAEAPTNEALRVAYRVAATFPPAVVEVTRHRLRVIRANPSLASTGAEHGPELRNLIGDFIAVREGTEAEALGVVIRSATLAEAATSALFWWAAHSDEPPEDVVDLALRIVLSPDGART